MRRKIWHFSKRTTVWLYRFVEAIVAFLLVVFCLAFWKLYTEPMDAAFLLPTLEKELLPESSGYTFEVASAQLSADFQEDGIFHLNMRDFHLIRPDKTVAIDLPEVSLSYGFWQIFTLNYMPAKLTLERPHIRMLIDEQGQWRLKAADEGQEKPIVPQKTAKRPTVRQILKYAFSFKSIEITDGVLYVDDLDKGESLSVPNFELHLGREYGLKLVANFKAVAQVENRLTDINVEASYGRITKKLDVQLGITPLYLSRYGRFASLLQGFDVPVALLASAEFDTEKQNPNFADNLEKLKFQVKTLKAGEMKMPSPIENTYHLKSATINGAASAGFKTVKIAESHVRLADGITADLEVETKGFDTFLKTKNAAALQTVLKAAVYDVPTEKVPAVWPKEQGPDAHAWVAQHLSKGSIPRADFKLTFNGGELTDVYGLVKAKGVKVDYLPDMPPVENASAEVILNQNWVKINVNKGQAGNVILQKANLYFDLVPEISTLAIDLKVAGPIGEMLNAINQKPLELLKQNPIDLKDIYGNALADVALSFPLEEATLTEKLKVKVGAHAENAALDLPAFHLHFSEIDADLKVDNQGLHLLADGAYQDQPIHFDWQEDFTASVGSNGRFKVTGDVDTETLIPLVADVEEYVKGRVVFVADLIQNAPNRLFNGVVHLDLTNAEVELHPIAATKKKGALAELILKPQELNTDFVQGAVAFDFLANESSKDKVAVKGSVSWKPTEWQMALAEVFSQENKFKADLIKSDNQLSLSVSGDAWNMTKFKQTPAFNKEKLLSRAWEWPDEIKLDVRLKKLVFNPDKPMTNVIVNGNRQTNVWKYFQAEASMQERFVLVMDPNKQTFHGQFNDLGVLMDYLNVSDRFTGGKLSLEAKQDKVGNIKGQVKVKKTELNDPPFLLQAASVLGLLDGIRGKSLVFDEIHIPFELLPEGVLNLGDSYAAGNSLGVTFKGVINLENMKITGNVIPAYMVNSLPGKIPFIGALFRDGAGGGLLGAKYTIEGPLKKPEVIFHPLSSMMPGALGYIF